MGALHPLQIWLQPLTNLPHIRDKNMVIKRELRIDTVTKPFLEKGSDATGREREREREH